MGKVANFGACALRAARKSVRRPLTSRVTVHWIGCPVAPSKATSLLWSRTGSWLLGLPVNSLNPGPAKTLRDPLLLSCLTDAEACVQSRKETSVSQVNGKAGTRTQGCYVSAQLPDPGVHPTYGTGSRQSCFGFSKPASFTLTWSRVTPSWLPCASTSGCLPALTSLPKPGAACTALPHCLPGLIPQPHFPYPSLSAPPSSQLALFQAFSALSHLMTSAPHRGQRARSAWDPSVAGGGQRRQVIELAPWGRSRGPHKSAHLESP